MANISKAEIYSLKGHFCETKYFIVKMLYPGLLECSGKKIKNKKY